MSTSDPEQLFWETVDGTRVGFLKTRHSVQLAQPMTLFPDRAMKRIYVFTSLESDLVRSVGSGADGDLQLVTGDRDVFLSAAGALTQRNDPELVRALWSPTLNAWFDGPDDAKLALIELQLRDARLWTVTSSTTTFVWEMARASVTDADPDLGDVLDVRF